MAALRCPPTVRKWAEGRRAWYHWRTRATPSAARVLDAWLHWAYTDEAPTTLAADSSRWLGMHTEETDTALQRTRADDLALYAARHGPPYARAWQQRRPESLLAALYHTRRQRGAFASGDAFGGASDPVAYQGLLLLLAGRLDPPPTFTRDDVLNLCDVLVRASWTEALQLVLAWALATLPASALPALAPLVLRHDTSSEAAMLARISRDPHAVGAAISDLPLRILDELSNRAVDGHDDLLLALLSAEAAAALPAAARARLEAQCAERFAQIVRLDRWRKAVLHSEPLMDRILSAFRAAWRPATAPRAYEVLVGDVVLADDGPWPTGRGYVLVEETRQALLAYLRTHWTSARAVHAFDHSAPWCIKELSYELDVPADFLTTVVAPKPAPLAEHSSMLAVTSAGLGTTRAPDKRGPASLYAAVLNRSAAQAAR